MVELRLLGASEVVGATGRVESLTRQPKRLALLFYLALARPRGFQRRDKLLSVFWPELDEHRARNALSQALHVLRSALGEEAILTRSEDEIAVASEFLGSDVVEFEKAVEGQRLESAVAFYHGAFLDGFHIAGAPDFERWVDAERVRLRNRASEAGWSLARQKQQAGDRIAAARHARVAAGLLIPDETQIRRLIAFLYELGDRSAAVRAYDEFVRELATEYELAPSAETQALAESIRSEPLASTTPAASAARPAPPAQLSDSGRTTTVRQRRAVRWLVAVLSVIALVAGITIARRSSAPPERPLVRFPLNFDGVPPLATGISGSTIALSPEGTRLVYVGIGARGTQLYLRAMDRLNAKPIGHTEGAYLPFISPSGDWLAFVVGDDIKKIKLTGGEPVMVCKVSAAVDGASWGDGDVIVFATPSGIWQVPSAGGTPHLVTPNDTAIRVLYRWPAILPGGKSAIVTRVDDSGLHLAVLTLGSGAVRSLGVDGTNPYFVESGFLVFGRPDGILRAAPFDPRNLRLTGAPRPIADGVIAGIGGAIKLGVSRFGVLAYVPEIPSRTVVIVDRVGRASPISFPPQNVANVRFSPDGRRIAISTAMVGGQSDVWVFDQLTKGRRPVTLDSGNVTPVWNPDGRRIIVGSKPGGRLIGFSIRAVAVDADEAPRVLLPSGPGQLPYAITPDGRVLFFRRFNIRRRSEIWILPLDRQAPPYPYVRGPFNARAAAISPDGHWLAYVSDESGRDEVYVRRFPDTGGALAVSVGGGREPQWAANGRELFYRSDSSMVVARFRRNPAFSVESRQVLFDDRLYETWVDGAEYDVHPDAEHFVMIRRGLERRDVVVVLNWFDQHSLETRLER